MLHLKLLTINSSNHNHKALLTATLTDPWQKAALPVLTGLTFCILANVHTKTSVIRHCPETVAVCDIYIFYLFCF